MCIRDSGNTGESILQSIEESYGNDFFTFEKRSFSLVTDDCKQILEKLKKENQMDTVIFTGIETHICVQQSCIDLVEMGFKGLFIFKKKLNKSYTS